ncbi:hypothetical protein AALO_G00054950 [Alosa alosa]|uniref:Uncharacterized protein n=1 Tax=Alosa alosa TaxID=278164 RepID=A0AAV6H501_9TELE|nr:hypothetical protein AALO_G00054950 [Alosa alosa]
MASIAPMNATSVKPVTEPPTQPDSAVIGVVVVLVLLTLAAGAFLLYRYLCHNKGAYRTTGEPAPGEDPDQVYNDTVVPIKKEYFI